MKARKREDGTPLDVGIHFVISWDGMVFQTCDLDTATVHVGSRLVNRSSIGVECCWPGTYRQARLLGVEGHELPGGFLRPSEAMLASWVRLAETLARHTQIPRQVPLTKRQFGRNENIGYRGAMEHWHVPGTTKIDAGGLLMQALSSAGWPRR
jgi:hypothetical protein